LGFISAAADVCPAIRRGFSFLDFVFLESGVSIFGICPPLSFLQTLTFYPFKKCIFAYMDAIVNKVAESSLITINLEQFLPQHLVVFDLKPFLFMELILKEKDFRAALLTHDWSVYAGKNVVVTCTADAIIPIWAYMLVMSYLQPVAKHAVMGSEQEAAKQMMISNINQLDQSEYNDQRIVIKGCGETPIPDEAYAAITFKLRPVAKSIMYGEPCSTVPIYKKKIVAGH
jgi:hypothetical protein